MFIQFKELSLTKFRSYESCKLTFEPGVFLVRGRREGNYVPDEFSNGSGKSSIFYGLSWTLFGRFFSPNFKVARGDRVVNRAYGKNCSGEVVFFRGKEKVCKVTRYQSHSKFKNKVVCEPPGFDPTTLVGCSLEAFFSLVFFTNYSLGGGLFYGTQSKRREYMTNLFCIDPFVRTLKERSKFERNHFRSEQASLSTLKGAFISKAEVLKDQMHAEEESVSLLKQRINRTKGELKDLLQEKKELEKVQAKLSDVQRVLDDLQKKFEKKKSELDSFIFPESELVRLSQFESDSQEVQFELNHLMTRAKTVSGLSGRCPTCEQEVPEEYVESVLKSLKAQKQKLESKLLEKNRKIEEIRSKKRDYDEKHDRLRSEVNSLYERHGELQRKYHLKKVKLAERLKSLGTQIKSTHARLADENSELKKFRSTVNPVITRKKLQRIEKTIPELEQDLTCISRLISGFDWWTSAISSSFVDYSLGKFYEEISEQSRPFLHSLWGADVEVSLSASGEPEIFVDGRRTDLTDLSTGEQRRIFLALALSSNMVARKYSGWSCNLLVFDEIYDGLDFKGRDELIRMVRVLRDYGYSVFLISHHSDTEVNNVDAILEVTKGKDGISRLKYLGGKNVGCS